MTALLELKQKIKEIYGQYEMYILPVMKFVRLNNVFLVLILALICSILPSSAMMYIGFVLILVHSYALGIEIAAFMLVLILLMMIFFLTAAVMCLPVMPFLMAMAVMFFSVRFFMTRASRSCRRGQTSVKVVHVMVMVLTVIIKPDMEITAVDARFLYSAYLYEKTACRDGVQRFLKSVRIRPQIDHCRHEHIPADPGAAVQV